MSISPVNHLKKQEARINAEMKHRCGLDSKTNAETLEQKKKKKKPTSWDVDQSE